MDLIEVTPEEVVKQYFSNNQESEDERSIEKLLESYEDFENSNYTYRKIHGVSPDENIFINGIVVGYSNADSIVLVARDGMIVDIINGTIKYHGLEKLGPVDLERVIVKTGLLRKSDDVNPRVISHNDISVSDIERNLYSGEISDDEYSFKVAYVDHAAYDIYKFKDFDLVVTIGDDTSLVASDILYRLNIPIIGITDGDLDKVVENGFVTDKSTFIEVSPGFDDIVGKYIHEELFLSKETLEVPFDEDAESVEEFKSIMLKVFKSHVLEKIKDIVPSFIEKDNEYNVVDSYHEVVDENPELVENLDEFIDGFDYEVYEEAEEVYLDDNYDSQVEEIYVEHNVEEISDAQLEEIIVEHLDDDLPTEEVFLDEDDSIIYAEDYPSEDEYLENIVEDEAYDENQFDEAVDSTVEEIYVEHEVDSLDEIYVEHGVDESSVEEIYVEHGVDESSVEEIYVEHDAEETIYEDVPVEEVYLDESVDILVSEDIVEESVAEAESDEIDQDDGSDGWAEYIEEEFGDSVDESDDSKEQD